MQTIIGREQEKSIINECLSSNQAEFLAVYGRRRIGKTFLIREFFDNSFAFYATGIPKVTKSQLLNAFNRALLKYGCMDETVPKNWFDAFAKLESLLDGESVRRDYQSGKAVVFLDEIPWMDSHGSDFKQALDWFWNSYASARNDLLFIICGSDVSWIIDNILKDTGCLHNHVTRRIPVMPFTLHECELFFQNRHIELSYHQIVECYMVFGGVPFYLNTLSPRLSLAQNIDKLLFHEFGELKQEFDVLYTSLFKKTEHYIRIVRCLSRHASGMTRSELLQASGMKSGGTATNVLKDLEQCGFIRQYENFSRDTNDSCYQLIDPFTLFYLDVVENRKVESWLTFVNSPSYYNWSGLAFEKTCMLHTRQIKTKLGISGSKTTEFAWHSTETSPSVQIDLVIDRADQTIHLCEVKYAPDTYNITAVDERNLIHKKEAFRTETQTQKSLFITMITSFGLVKNAHWQIVANELTESDLFVE